MELERPRLRPGESSGRPWGGNVSKEPFPQALYNLARSRGFESQTVLARALGVGSNNTISRWYRGLSVPAPESFGVLLRLLQPDEKELDSIVEPWRKLVAAGSESARIAGLKRLRASETPVGKWLEETCRQRKMTVDALGDTLGIHPGDRDLLSLSTLSKLLETPPQALGLSDQEAGALVEAVASTIEGRLAQGHRYQDSVGAALKKAQQELPCRTFNGQQAADLLKVTRERVRQLRNEFDLPLLLSKKDLKLLRHRRKAKSPGS